MHIQPQEAVMDLYIAFKKHPQMFVYPVTVDKVISFLDGVHAACRAFGLEVDKGPDSIFQQVIIERGWTFLAARPVNEMQERGLDVLAIVNELLTIELETWKRSFSSEQNSDELRD